MSRICAASRTRRSISSFGTFWLRRPNARLSYTVMCGYSAYDWNTIATSRSAGATSLTTRSPMRISPPVISSRPASIRSAVLFPQPEGPTSTRNSPSAMSSSRPSTATASSNAFVTRSYVTVATAPPLPTPPKVKHPPSSGRRVRSPPVTPLARDLARVGQDHLLEGVDALSTERRERFLARLTEIDWDELAHPAEPPPVEDVAPPRVVTLGERAERHAELVAAGEDAYRAGRVAVLVVAGGQGTRLGWDGPKGTFPLGPHSGKTIYELQAEKVLALSRRLGRDVPLLVLTSPATDAATRSFFAERDDLGLAPGQLRLFTQGTVPSVDRDGRALLAAPGVLLENPDGHGGVFQALVRSGELERLRREGVTTIVYVQVDNVLAPVDDPELVGLAAVERADVVTKVLPKAHPDEKVGHLVRVGERDRIVEYTELTPEETRATTPDGELLYRWGSPAMHAWSVEFLVRLADRGYRPPLHRSAKPLEA